MNTTKALADFTGTEKNEFTSETSDERLEKLSGFDRRELLQARIEKIAAALTNEALDEFEYHRVLTLVSTQLIDLGREVKMTAREIKALEGKLRASTP